MKQIWFERLLRWNQQIQKILVGRYARIDQLNRTLLMISFILLVLNLMIPTSVAFFIAVILWLLTCYRFLSKRIYLRLNENTRYVAKVHQVKAYINLKKEQVKNRQTYRYFRCPACKQQLRAPKNRGKIKVTCSKCKNQFYKTV